MIRSKIGIKKFTFLEDSEFQFVIRTDLLVVNSVFVKLIGLFVKLFWYHVDRNTYMKVNVVGENFQVGASRIQTFSIF